MQYANVNENYNILESEIVSSLDKIIPLKKKFNKYKHKKCQWITNGILKSIKYKDHLYRSLKITPSESPEYHMKKNNLKVYKKILNKCIRSAKKAYYFTQFQKYKSNVSKTWSVLQDIIKTPTNESDTSQLIINGNIVTDKLANEFKRVANEFNKYFYNVGQNLSQNLNSNSNNTFKHYLQNIISSKFSFKKVTTKEIEHIIKELQSKNSTGLISITSFVSIINFNNQSVTKHRDIPKQIKVSKTGPNF